jgi:hypothetical protein
MEPDVGQRYDFPQRRVEDFLREHVCWLHVQSVLTVDEINGICLLVIELWVLVRRSALEVINGIF